MCGISGFVDTRCRLSSEARVEACSAMTSALAHRGPDDSGAYFEHESGVALGHRRLSILDLSALGHQPMTSASGDHVITYNGELYNFQALKAELPEYGYVGHSDTEVILAAVEAWGLERALQRFDGMFAFALWSKSERALYLARDRFGEKPLYYGVVDGHFVFGSELKAIRAFPGFVPAIDRQVLARFMRFGYVPAPDSIFQGIKKLPPASWARLRAGSSLDVEVRSYWSYVELARAGLAEPSPMTDTEAIGALDALLVKTFESRLVADVPVGTFLSGGIDSSVVVAALQASATRKVKTFTVGFDDVMYDESESARRVAEHLGTEHTELRVSAEQAREVIPRLPFLYDEPFADSSQVPTFLVAQLARQHVTVALSGDGGDEIFGGYNRYTRAPNVWRYLAAIPLPLRSSLAAASRLARPGAVDAPFAYLNTLLPPRYAVRSPADKLQKVAEMIGATGEEDLFVRLISSWKRTDFVRGAPARTEAAHLPAVGSFVDAMMCADATTYLPEDILVKVDRATMGVSLEARAPFLSAEIARFAWSLPHDMKLRQQKGKWILREVLARYVPRKLFERPKMGFGIPIDDWLRGPLRDWAEELLGESRLEREGYFDPAPIRRKWEEHLSGQRNWQEPLWNVLMFQSWLSAWSS